MIFDHPQKKQTNFFLLYCHDNNGTNVDFIFLLERIFYSIFIV